MFNFCENNQLKNKVQINIIQRLNKIINKQQKSVKRYFEIDNFIK